MALFRLWYFFEGTDALHCVLISKYKFVADLEREIQSQCKPDLCNDVPPGHLILLKVRNHLSPQGLSWCSEQHSYQLL